MEERDAAALAELLRAYPGLLDGHVEAVARALAQATLAVSKMAALGGDELSAVERVRLGRSLSAAAVPAAETTAAVAERTVAAEATAEAAAEAAAAAAAAGGARRAGRGGGGGRRWHTQEHLRRLQREGVVFRKGKFTAEENAAIDGAVAAFVEEHGVSGPEMYARLFQRGERNAEARRARRAFWPAVAEALPERQVQAIYHHVRRKFHPHNYQGAWTAGEDAELRRLVAAHGPAWEAISGQLGRMGTNCRDRWRYIRGQHQQGAAMDLARPAADAPP
ncbi:RNA polymerase I enhancer binding protein [Coemansia javaensis]|uniref:RNA polymerase I enhancer binding protein n=1 Tax=Coemansia javaensis TaxID=2761396 RepID=A0A9W8H322_9FUNG|nr:RNA polymerase I enhancer binding protein [Coemansia javaensis]